MEINKAIEEAKKPGGVNCPKCGDKVFSPIDKLSIYLYGECVIHLKDDSSQVKNLLTLSEQF